MTVKVFYLRGAERNKGDKWGQLRLSPKLFALIGAILNATVLNVGGLDGQI